MAENLNMEQDYEPLYPKPRLLIRVLNVIGSIAKSFLLILIGIVLGMAGSLILIHMGLI